MCPLKNINIEMEMSTFVYVVLEKEHWKQFEYTI